MDESILRMHDKPTLKNMAFDKGLSRRGFNGRNASRMRKQDFIDFILYKDRMERSLENGSASPSLEDEMIEMFQEIILDDTISPIFQIMDALNNLQGRNTIIFGRSSLSSNDSSSNDSKEPERVPNEEDEVVPDLSLKETEKSSCNDDCICEICQKNKEIEKENLKVKTTIHDLENKISCVVCQSNVRNVVFSPCNHLATCITCSKNPLLNKKCPLCRKVFETTTRIFS